MRRRRRRADRHIVAEIVIVRDDSSGTTPAYTTHSFRPALTVEPPSWLPPAPSTDEKHFLTWTGKGADVDRAVRFTSPVGLYDPGRHRHRLSPRRRTTSPT